jgi:hypothetical protein
VIESTAYIKVTLSSDTPPTPGEVANVVWEQLTRSGFLIGWKDIKTEPVNHTNPSA